MGVYWWLVIDAETLVWSLTKHLSWDGPILKFTTTLNLLPSVNHIFRNSSWINHPICSKWSDSAENQHAFLLLPLKIMQPVFSLRLVGVFVFKNTRPHPLSHTCMACTWRSFIKTPRSEASGCCRWIVAGELATEEVSASPHHRRRCLCQAVPGRWAFSQTWPLISWSCCERNLAGATSWSLCSSSQLPSCLLMLFCLLVNDELWCG